jgi:undecaprenyl-diphosphatase
MDQHLLFLINQRWTHPFLDRALGTLSSMDFWTPLLVLGAAYLVWKHRVRGTACVAICLLGVCLNESCIAQPLKKLTHRARPHQTFEGVRRVNVAGVRPRLLSVAHPMQIGHSGKPDPNDQTRRSFPSAHVLNATLLGVVLWSFTRWSGWLLLPPLMAWSRVYTGAHWPSDVLASLLLGVPFSLLLLRGCESLWRGPLTRRFPRWTSGNPSLVSPLLTEPKPPTNQGPSRANSLHS